MANEIFAKNAKILEKTNIQKYFKSAINILDQLDQYNTTPQEIPSNAAKNNQIYKNEEEHAFFWHTPKIVKFKKIHSKTVNN